MFSETSEMSDSIIELFDGTTNVIDGTTETPGMLDRTTDVIDSDTNVVEDGEGLSATTDNLFAADDYDDLPDREDHKLTDLGILLIFGSGFGMGYGGAALYKKVSKSRDQ